MASSVYRSDYAPILQSTFLNQYLASRRERDIRKEKNLSHFPLFWENITGDNARKREDSERMLRDILGLSPGANIPRSVEGWRECVCLCLCVCVCKCDCCLIEMKTGERLQMSFNILRRLHSAILSNSGFSLPLTQIFK